MKKEITGLFDWNQPSKPTREASGNKSTQNYIKTHTLFMVVDGPREWWQQNHSIYFVNAMSYMLMTIYCARLFNMVALWCTYRLKDPIVSPGSHWFLQWKPGPRWVHRRKLLHRHCATTAHWKQGWVYWFNSQCLIYNNALGFQPSLWTGLKSQLALYAANIWPN